MKTKAKENLSLGGKGLPTLAKVDTRKELSKLSKTSEGTISKVKFIEDKADKKTKEKLSKGEETINKVYTNLKRKEKVKDIHEELSKPKAKENKLGRGKVLQNSVKLNVQKETAKIAKVSHDTVSKVKFIEDKAKLLKKL